MLHTRILPFLLISLSLSLVVASPVEEDEATKNDIKDNGDKEIDSFQRLFIEDDSVYEVTEGFKRFVDFLPSIKDKVLFRCDKPSPGISIFPQEGFVFVPRPKPPDYDKAWYQDPIDGQWYNQYDWYKDECGGWDYDYREKYSFRWTKNKMGVLVPIPIRMPEVDTSLTLESQKQNFSRPGEKWFWMGDKWLPGDQKPQPDEKSRLFAEEEDLPMCDTKPNCESCLANSNFGPCWWCPTLGRCSDGRDSNRQSWWKSKCDIYNISTLLQCNPDYGLYFETDLPDYDSQTNSYYDYPDVHDSQTDSQNFHMGPMEIVVVSVFITMIGISFFTLVVRRILSDPPINVEDAKKEAAHKIKLPKTEAFQKILIF